jgi:tetratricopeptide (TPR) repeat protein
MGAGCSKSARAKRLLAAADQDFQSSQYDAAELKYRGVLRLSYMNPVAIRQLGLIYFAEGRPTQAAPVLNKALELDSTNLEVAIKLAQSLLDLGKIKPAYILATKVLQKEPSNEDALLLWVDLARNSTNLNIVHRQVEKLQSTSPDAASFHAALAWIDLRYRETDAAEAEIQKGLKLDPKMATLYVARAAIAVTHNNMPAASDDLKSAADLSPIRSQARIKYADFKYKVGLTNEAVQSLEDVTRQAPDFIPAWVGLMQLYYSERNYDRCNDVIAKILARDSINFEALMQSANLYMDKHDGTNAIAMFKRLVSVPMYKDIPTVKYRMAQAYLMNGDRVDAVACLNESLATNRNDIASSLLLANLDLRGGNPLSAVNILQPLVKQGPQSPDAYFVLATSYLAERQPAEALAVYHQMTTVYPKDPEAFRLMGIVYQQTGDEAQARDSFEKSLALAPEYMPTLEKITDLDMIAKRYDNAQNRLDSVMKKNPKLAEPWLLEGALYWANRKTNQAEAAMSKAIELDPSLPGAYLALARLYLSAHQEQQALEHLNALVSKTNDVTAMLEIGQIQQEAGKFDQARDAYEKLVAFAPEFAPALNNLAFLYSDHYGNLEKAAQMAERARKLSPEDPNVADTLGWILYKQGQYPRALGLIQESLEKQPNSPDVQMHLGMTYYMTEEEDLARLHLQQAVSSSRDFTGKDEARQCLALLAIDPAKATPAEIDVLEKRLHDTPRDPVPLNRLAAIYEIHGETDKALDAYQKLLAENPKDWKAMIKLGRLYSSSLHDTRKALELAKSAHELAPGDPRATAMLGELVYASGDHAWALSLLEESAPKLTNQPAVQYDLALAYYAVGRLPEADAAMSEAVQAGASLPNLDQAKQFQAFRAAATDPAANPIPADQIKSALDKDPHFLPALALSGILLEKHGDITQATKTFEQILAEYPKFTPAMRELAIIYARNNGDVSKAYELGEKARTTFQDDLDLARTLGILAYRKGEFQRSKSLLEQSAQKFDNDGEVSYYLGMDSYQLKRPTETKRYLKQAVALNVPSPMSDDAKKVLGELK